MAKPILDDALWALIEPLLPEAKPRRFRYPGRKPIGNREALTGILFVLISGVPWEMLPQELGCGSGMSCWRRLRDWTAAGVWQKIHSVLLDRLRQADKIDWSRAVIDSAPVRAVFGGTRPAQTPRIEAKRSKHPVLTDANGIPLAAQTTAANDHDVTQLLPLVTSIPRVGASLVRVGHLPDRVQGDRAYDSEDDRALMRWLGITPVLARRNTEHGSGLGRTRWVVERTLSWLYQYRRLRVRYERRADIHQAFLDIGCILICYKCLFGSFC